MKKIFSFILAMIMVLSLTACGGKDNADADKAGGEQEETIVLGDYTAVFKGYTLTKDEDGRDALCLTYDFTNGSKEEQSFAWAFLYEATQNGEGLDFPGFDENGEKLEANLEEKIQKNQTIEVKMGIALVNTTDDVMIYFSDFDDHEYTQTIRLSGAGGKEAGSAEKGDISTAAEQENETVNLGDTEELTPFQEYWNGDWYGWTSYSNGTNDYSSLDGFYMDCMARIEIDENGDGGLILWDEATSVDNPRAGVYVSVSDGGFPQGRLKSMEGLFSDGDVGNADWLVDPDGLGYENLICIEGSYKDPEDFFSGYDYKIYLRPWGLNWADIEADQPDNLPTYYYDWYLPAIQAGAAMPDVIGGDYGSLAPGEVSDAQMEGQGGNDPNASAVDGTWQAPVYGDYGLSKASATGVVPMTRDELIDRISFYADSQIGSAPYDSLYNSMGYVHGKPMIDDPRWDTGKTHVYQWSIESGEYAIMVFEVTDYSIGIEKLQAVETSPGLLD